MISSPDKPSSLSKTIHVALIVLMLFDFYLMSSMLGFFQHQAFWSAVSIGLVHALFVGACYWVLWLAGAPGRKRRQANSELRRKGMLRSPWGQIRTTDPQPFSERLNAFKSAYEAGDTQIEEGSQEAGVATSLSGDQADSYQSAMSYWSIVDVPRDIEPPKPVWYLRRMLQRIRDALHGYR